MSHINSKKIASQEGEHPHCLKNDAIDTKRVLVGNPNVGKSVLFNALTGVYVEVSNYPGTTVDFSQGCYKDFTIIDTPGIYGIGDYNEEETVARDILLNNKHVINIVSAVSLERDLFLTQQLIDMGFSLIVVLNQMDEAEARGVKIDLLRLKELLGVDVFPAVATKNHGIDAVKANLNKTQKGNAIAETLAYADKITKRGLSRVEALLGLEGDMSIKAKYPDVAISNRQEEIYALRRKYVNRIVEECVEETSSGASISTKIGHALLNPAIGWTSAALVLYLLYQLIGVWIAGDIVGITEGFFADNYLPWAKDLTASLISTNWLVELLAGEFGILTMTIQYVFGLLLPIVIGFNIFFALLEDSGYLPRLAVLFDKFFTRLGLNGRAVIPILLGFGCITMAIMSSRILGSDREKTIAIAILALTVPCSAQLGIILALLASTATAWAWIVYLATIATVLLLLCFVLNKFLPGETTGLMIDLPPMRWPTLKNTFNKSVTKTWGFLYEAVPMFAAGTLILGTLSISGGLNWIQDKLSPLVVQVLQLPAETSDVFIMGLIRRDFAATGLADMAGIGTGDAVISSIQIVVSIVVITLFVPCIAALMIMFKERGLVETLALWIVSIVLAFATGGVLSYLLNYINTVI